MARAGIGPIIADRVSPPPKTPPPRFTPPPPPPMFSIPPRFTAPPYFVPPPPPPPMFSIPPPAAREQASSRAAFEASGMSLTQYMRTLDNQAGPPPPPPMFSPPMFSPPPPPMFVPQPAATQDNVVEQDPGPGEEEQSNAVVVNPEPSYPTPPPPPPPPPKIKVAPIDTVLFDDDAVPKEIIADLLFESIGGQEILTIARHDTVNGQTVLYQPIKNINILQQQYNPSNLLKLRDTSNTIFGNFTINLTNKIPQVGNGSGGSNTYLDSSGNLVIEFVNLANDELVEVQIASSGTIYEAG